MRGRGGHSSSSVSQQQTRMALRKQILKDASDIPTGSQPADENTQEDETLNDQDNTVKNDELSLSLLSSSREKRKKERENKSKPKEMTEEEMMALALRLSEQEASVTALRLQEEEEAVMKAIQESMVSQTQPCSQSLLADAEASLRICSRRKLLYSNRKKASANEQGASEDTCTPETDVNRGAKGSGDESNNRSKKRKRKEGSPLLEMPDLSQTQKIYSQASPCSSECPSVPLDSPQSCDSTQIDDCQLRKSPVFSSTGSRAEVHIPRLNQDLLESCRTSGFVLCSQDSLTSTQKSQPAEPKSPTFPKSPKCSGNHTLSKSPNFLETDQEDDRETEQSPEYFKSPVFGRITQHERSPSACKPPDRVCNSEFMFSSQGSLTPSVRSTSCQPKSPVFPRSPGVSKNVAPSETLVSSNSPVFSETDGEQTEQSLGCCISPVFGGTPQQQQKIHLDEQKDSVSPSAAGLRGSATEKNSTTSSGPSQSLRQDSKINNQEVGFNNSSQSDDAEEPNRTSKDWNSADMELTSDMTLHWSDEDDDVTPVGSPSPVFPEERRVHQADSQAASLNHTTEASPGTNCRPSSSSTSAAPVEPGGRPMVHYYWGVPFCPRGLDPDKYTQVILAQMEVYEKSLKQAQRCLLRKAEWGDAIQPQPEKSPSPESPESPQLLVPQRRGLRLRGRKLCESADSPSAEAEEEEDKKEEEEERQSKEEEKKEEEDGEVQVDTDDCEVCPETQLTDNDDDRTQDLMMDTDAGTKSDVKKSREQPEVEMILRDDSPAGDELQEEEMEVEVDALEDRKTKGDVPVSNSSSDIGKQHVRNETVEDKDPDVEEIKDRGLQRSMSPELEPATVPESPETKVDCPICQGSFPVTEIEMHAAYCDGEVAVVDERRPENNSSLKPRRKRTRRTETTDEETDPSNAGKNREKCYICQKAVPLRDYNRHTEICIQRQASKTKGNLLSALEQTESRDSDAGPSGSKVQPGDVIDLRDDDEDEDVAEEGSISMLRISNSPIRSFTPISEATGCLIDFKKQQRVKKPRQRRR
ncbi:BRCA1-A complex subunit RAP80 isoform X3 [Plectropomus leopardus]|uniref:BRCA1-A complex subunit RAP80 isoform X3 n=1 Tax=Plectropomus leopardus TaxID=160734 RepID=UPI001C4B686D|nr:BRCA1-A complex subunit RAP80 isoform X3 [Plectropomus leopardus]